MNKNAVSLEFMPKTFRVLNNQPTGGTDFLSMLLQAMQDGAKENLENENATKNTHQQPILAELVASLLSLYTRDMEGGSSLPPKEGIDFSPISKEKGGNILSPTPTIDSQGNMLEVSHLILTNFAGPATDSRADLHNLLFPSELKATEAVDLKVLVGNAQVDWHDSYARNMETAHAETNGEGLYDSEGFFSKLKTERSLPEDAPLKAFNEQSAHASKDTLPRVFYGQIFQGNDAQNPRGLQKNPSLWEAENYQSVQVLTEVKDEQSFKDGSRQRQDSPKTTVLEGTKHTSLENPEGLKLKEFSNAEGIKPHNKEDILSIFDKTTESGDYDNKEVQAGSSNARVHWLQNITSEKEAIVREGSEKQEIRQRMDNAEGKKGSNHELSHLHHNPQEMGKERTSPQDTRVEAVEKRPLINHETTKHMNVRIEEANIRLSMLGERLRLFINIGEEAYRQPTTLEVQRLVQSLQSIGYNLEVLKLNGNNLYSSDNRHGGRREEREKEGTGLLKNLSEVKEGKTNSFSLYL
ncbi:MAG: hypothetical protein NZ851_00820 [Aquificaceae bacterium]|nr:hypothetical protein [Aquificaceae bacterium]